MNRVLKWGIALAVLTCIGLIIWHFTPKKINRTVEGIYFVAGKEGTEKPIRILIDGKLQWTLDGFWSGRRVFHGRFEIGNEELPVPEDASLQIYIEDDQGTITYLWIDSGNPGGHTVGFLYVNSDFSEFAIEQYDEKGAWSGDNGITIAAPASSRTKALDIANRRMKKILHGFVLK